jgi:predicted esterase
MKKNFTPFQILPEVITYRNLRCNAFFFIPEQYENASHLAIFTHGFTASKTDLLTWSARLLDLNIPSVIFDLPGHLLGSFEQAPSLEEFLQDSPYLFVEAEKSLKEKLPFLKIQNKLILGGHSLGALFSLKAAVTQDEQFSERVEFLIAVGFGLNNQVKTHLFESDLYRKTLQLRGQLVAPTIPYEKVFKWIREQKLDLPVKNKKIYLLCGKDDAVVGAQGAEILKQMLAPFNEVTLEKPDQLPHHRPELAAAHIFHFLKNSLKKDVT